MRLLQTLLLTLSILFGAQISAGELASIGTPVTKSLNGKHAKKKWYYPFEIGELKIKQSNDGTGIIRQVSCTGCDYQFVKITPYTEVFINGKKAGLLRARERAGLPVFIEFDKKTAEVKHIYWAE